MLTYKNSKAKPCEVCQNLFVPDRMGQLVCRPACAMKKVRQEKVEERAKVRTRKEAIKTIPVLIKEAQREFNAYIRFRDAEQPCISCGSPLVPDAAGGGFDCGHYRSTGSASHLRFHPDNAHGQCKHCNRWLAGRVADYRIGLLGRIGIERLAAIETDNTPHKWTREELIAIRDTYRAKRKEMRK
jgi:hypothetical protein